MAADFKSHILSRDEKGFGGIPFKRLLLGGIGGGFTYALGRFALPDLALSAGLTVALLLVALTAPRGGLPLWLRLWLKARGSLLLAAAAAPTGWAAALAHLLALSSAAAVLDGDALFAPPAAHNEVDLAEWVTFARARDLDRGDALVFVPSPLAEETP